MMTAQEIPTTRGGTNFRRLLWIVGAAAIVGITDQARLLFWMALSGPDSVSREPATTVLMLVGWVLMGWCALRGVRDNRMPPAWAVVAIVLLVWVRTLWPF